MKEKPDLKRVMNEYRHNMKEDLFALWKVWVPATFANFFFAPMHLRIVGVAATSLIWTCILSVMRGGDVEHADDMIGGAVTRASFTLLQEGLDERYNTSPVELDPELGHICISATGNERPGLVALLARHVARHEGNVTHSKMVVSVDLWAFDRWLGQILFWQQCSHRLSFLLDYSAWEPHL